MNSLLLGLSLATSPSTAALPPAPYPPPGAHTASYQSYQSRTAYQSYQSRYTPYPPPPPYHPAAYQPPPAPAYPPPAPVPPPAPPAFYPPTPPAPVHDRPMTLEHFEHCFVPTCGVHHLTFIHPVTCQPVHVCLKLPHGEVPRVCVHRRSIEFDYRHHDDIEVEFNRNGTVSIDYDD